MVMDPGTGHAVYPSGRNHPQQRDDSAMTSNGRDPWEGMSTPPPAPPAPPWWRTPRTWIFVAGGLVVFVVGLIFGALIGGDDGEAAATTTTAAPGVTAPSPTGGDATQPPSTGGPITTTTGPDSPVTTTSPPPPDVLEVYGTGQVIAVKVDNSPPARPQVGLNEAEIIFEVPVEGGLTRFTAMYLRARPLVVGPVRSVRPVDPDLLAPFSPVLASSGGQSFVRREIDAAGITDLTVDNGEFFQVLERPSPYNIVATIPLIAQESGGGPPSVAPLPFGADDIDGVSADEVRIPFSAVNDVTWEWNGSDYGRFVGDDVFETLTEFNGSLEPFTSDTVLVLVVASRSAGYTDTAGSDVPTFDVIGAGRFLLFHGGSFVEGEWRRASQAEGYRLINPDGTTRRLPPGRLFVEVVPREIEIAVG
jgi:hypothetical protein